MNFLVIQIKLYKAPIKGLTILDVFTPSDLIRGNDYCKALEVNNT
ncbi:hypothetical protein VP424E501_P0150 [Vibrio phage 424E50-1]|nr:hypothetical protein VP424E501_P0150 [Vibrio phage 424E50-1]